MKWPHGLRNCVMAIQAVYYCLLFIFLHVAAPHNRYRTTITTQAIAKGIIDWLNNRTTIKKAIGDRDRAWNARGIERLFYWSARCDLFIDFRLSISNKFRTYSMNVANFIYIVERWRYFKILFVCSIEESFMNAKSTLLSL